MRPDINSEAVRPLGKYPNVCRAGDYLFVSGMSARLADGSVPGDAREQTHVVIGKIRDALQSEGAQLSDCVAITSYLVDMRDFDAYNTVYGDYFSERAPARTTVAVHQLPHPDMLVELTATAYRPLA